MLLEVFPKGPAGLVEDEEGEVDLGRRDRFKVKRGETLRKLRACRRTDSSPGMGRCLLAKSQRMGRDGACQCKMEGRIQIVLEIRPERITQILIAVATGCNDR